MRSVTSQEGYFFRVLDRIITASEYLALFALWMIVFLLLSDVTIRYMFHKTSDWSLDVVQLLQVLFAFAASAPVLRLGEHISMNALPSIVSNDTKRRLDILSNGICTMGSIWMVAITWKTFVRSYQISEAAFGVAMPLYPWKFIVPLGFFLLTLQFFRLFVDNFRN